MSMMDDLRKKMKAADEVVAEFMASPCCGEDAAAEKEKEEK